jgi:hypothetical protein
MGELNLALFHGREPVEGLFKPTLTLLRYMAERSNKELRNDDILDELWPESIPNIVEKHVSLIRNALGDTKLPEEPLFIETIHGIGYKFLPKITRSGDLRDIEPYSEWSDERFFQLMKLVQRGTGPEKEDLRITSTGFSGSIEQLRLDHLIKKRQARISILMMDPANAPLIDARYLLRSDKPYEQNIRELKDQIAYIENLARRYPPQGPDPSIGSIELHLSDTMPCGCVFHAANWAVVGIFLAHDSYSKEPMMEIRGDSEPWKVLHDDWKARWEAAVRKKAVGQGS